MKISNVWTWADVLRHQGMDSSSTADVVFRCRGGAIVESNLLILSMSSNLLRMVLADLPPYQRLVEPGGMLTITFPDVEPATVRQWIQLVHSGAIAIHRDRVDPFADFLKKVIMFTGECQLLAEDEVTSPVESKVCVNRECEEDPSDSHTRTGEDPASLAPPHEEDLPLELGDDEVSAAGGCTTPSPAAPTTTTAATTPEPMEADQTTTMPRPVEAAGSAQPRSKATSPRVKKWTCPECPKEFAQKNLIFRHSVFAHYGSEIEEICSSNYDDKTGCLICKKKLQKCKYKSTRRNQKKLHLGATHRMIRRFMDEETWRKYCEPKL